MTHESQAPNWYRDQRAAMGWTQEQVARAADVSLRTVCNAEAGQPLKPKIRQRIERALTRAALKRSLER